MVTITRAGKDKSRFCIFTFSSAFPFGQTVHFCTFALGERPSTFATCIENHSYLFGTSPVTETAESDFQEMWTKFKCVLRKNGRVKTKVAPS